MTSQLNPVSQNRFRGRGYSERPNLISGAALGSQTAFSKEFPMGEGWYKLMLRFNLNFTVGTGTTPIAEGELLFIKNILLRSDRGEVLVNLPGRALYKIATYRTGEAPRKDAIAAASAVYRVNLPVFFTDKRTDRPEDTILDTSRYRSCQLMVTIGTVADLLSTVGTSSVSTTLDIEIERSLGVLPNESKPFWFTSYDFRPPVDANSLTTIDLERSPDMSIKRLYVHSCTGGTAGLPWSGANADTIQSFASVKDQNKFIEFQRFHQMIQEMNKIDTQLESTITGVEVFDFIQDGSTTSSLATGDKSVLQYFWVNQGGVGANSLVTATQEMIRTLK